MRRRSRQSPCLFAESRIPASSHWRPKGCGCKCFLQSHSALALPSSSARPKRWSAGRGGFLLHVRPHGDKRPSSAAVEHGEEKPSNLHGWYSRAAAFLTSNLIFSARLGKSAPSKCKTQKKRCRISLSRQ